MADPGATDGSDASTDASESTDGSDGTMDPNFLDWVSVPGGSFTMGSPDTDTEALSNEKPQVSVTISRDFEIASTEITREQWQHVMGETAGGSPGCDTANCPKDASWDDAVDFCNTLSDRVGLARCYGDGRAFLGVECPGYRLPTEAEWEYAARAGNTSPRYYDLDKIAWYGEGSDTAPHPVGQKTPNAWGLYDMLGNVWEWSQDIYGDNPTGGTDPVVSSGSGSRALRGGCFSCTAPYSRAAARLGRPRTDRAAVLGFRPVRTIP